MSRVKTHCEIDIYEQDGKEQFGAVPKLKIESHWNRNALVILHVGEHEFTVSADELCSAINRCSR